MRVLAVARRVQFVVRDESERRGSDAVSKTALFLGSVVKHVSEVTVTVRRTHFYPRHTKSAILQFDDVLRLDRCGETRPPASTVELLGGGEERLAAHDANAQARFVVVPKLSAERWLRRTLLGHGILMRGQSSDRLRVFHVFFAHRFSFDRGALDRKSTRLNSSHLG